MGETEIVLTSLAFWLALLLTCTLPTISGSQTQPTHRVGEGLSWMDLYNRSQCQPRSVLLNLLAEFPQFSDSLFLPPCVSVKRCSGCCLDEGLSCVPTHMQNITMQVMKTKLLQPELTEIGIPQHTRCQCRPKGNDTLKANRSVCAPCGRRRTLNTKTCKCICNWNEEKCHQKGQTFNKGKCRCEKTNS